MLGITFLIALISYFVLLPFIFLTFRKKAIKSMSFSLEEIKKHVKIMKITGIFFIPLLCLSIYLNYKSYCNIQNPILFANSILSLIGMPYFPFLYMVIIHIPFIKAKEKEQKNKNIPA